MSEFLAENNACGQNLLEIVSFGNSIIAEILRLKDFIPDIYRLETKSHQQKYANIILDFSYLKIQDAHEKKIESNPTLQELDDEINKNYFDLVKRFYQAFEGIHQYAVDLKNYANELDRGYYIQQSLESVLQNNEGKQLLCEALYIYGVMLLVLDYYIPGVVRERLIVSYYRYNSGGEQATEKSNIDDVCVLLRSTGFNGKPNMTMTSTSSKTNDSTVPRYPEAYFARYTFDPNFVDLIIGRLRSDDIYNQLAIYPHSKHRTTALSNQAAMLYVCLYFSPKILHNQVAQMREIVDKYFHDNWVISIYMGLTVNLIDAWDSFKAAKTALMPVCEPLSIKGFCRLHHENMEKLLVKTKELLREGVLNDFYILENINQLVVLLRQMNVLLRWYFLHTLDPVLIITRTCQKPQQIKQIVQTELDFKKDQVFLYLLNCSEVELVIKDQLRDLMREREKRWTKYRKDATDRLSELSEAFDGIRPLSKIPSNPQLKQWFAELAAEVEKQQIDDAKQAGLYLIQLIQALEEVQDYYNMHNNMQVKQYVIETIGMLHRMMQIINIKEELEIRIQMITDFSYAWIIMDRDFLSTMQENIKNHPKSVIRIRAAFLKLASALEIPLMRINQSKSEDIESVSNYYSTELANYMRKVLQIVPESMFKILARIIKLQKDVLKEFPETVEKDKIGEYAQFDERYEMSKLTYNIAILTQGILMMKKTLVGVIELDPKQLLEDGIRKELVLHLSNALNLGLIFTPVKGKDPTSELHRKLEDLANVRDSYRRSFEYVSDYIKINGLLLLQEEFRRIMNFNIEREYNAFLGIKVLDWQSQYQSTSIPIPTFSPLQGDISNSNNFIGRLAREILNATDPKNTTYVNLKATWYDKRAINNAVVEPAFFTTLREAIAPIGMAGLDRLYGHMLTEELKLNLGKLQKNFTSDKMWCEVLGTLTKELESEDFPGDHAKNPQKFYNSYVTRWQRVWPTLLDWVLGMGQKQLVRQRIASELKLNCKLEDKVLENSLDALNRALLLELRTNNNLYNEEGVKKLVEINEYLLFVGNYEPKEQVFVKTRNSHNLSLFLFLFTIAHVPRLQQSKVTHTMQAKSPKDCIDGPPFFAGILTILKQFHNKVKMLYISYLCQYVNVITEHDLTVKEILSNDVVQLLHFLHTFIKQAHISRNELEKRTPDLILTVFEDLAMPPIKA